MTQLTTDQPLRLDDELLDAWANDARMQDLTEKTVDEYRMCLDVFGRLNPDLDVREIGHEHLRVMLKQLRDKDRADSTISHYFCAINSLCDFLVYREILGANPVKSFRKRYLKGLRSEYRSKGPGAYKQLIGIDEMRKLVNLPLKLRDKAILTVLAKTGVRRSELEAMDVEDINWDDLSIQLKADLKKRKGNRTVFFDEETAHVLRDWLDEREQWLDEDDETDALFPNQEGDRLARTGIYNVVRKYAERLGIHDPDSDDPQDRFTTHNFRHWFSTWLRRNDMQREHLQELRGDVRNDTVDYYTHIDREELRREYRRSIPRLYIR